MSGDAYTRGKCCGYIYMNVIFRSCITLIIIHNISSPYYVLMWLELHAIKLSCSSKQLLFFNTAAMLLLSRIAPVIVLAVVVKCVNGYQRIVHINELFSDDEDFYSNGNKDLISGSGEINDLYFDNENDIINLLCCVYGNCSCHSFADALGNLTSNLLLNITTNVTLTSVIHASNLVNVVIIGHNNPTVYCRGAGGIHFTSCHNCIIQGITWDGCGTDNNEPGLKLTNSSDITIQKCSFQHSRGQAVALSEISGYLNINNCKFANNSQYKGHGAIINILFSTVKNSLQSFKIHACNFSDNKGARSLIYINNKIFEHNINITISSSEFYHNQLRCICLHY